MNNSTPGKPTPEDREPTSFAENAKNLIKKHKGKILALGSALGSVALAVVVTGLAEGRNTEEAEDQEPVSDPETTDERRSPSAYDVDPHLRRLPEGQNASEEKKAKYKDETGDDLPPGQTWVGGWSFPATPRRMRTPAKPQPEHLREGHLGLSVLCSASGATAERLCRR